MGTYSAKPGQVEQKWYVVNADGLVLGRMATEIANILRGKNKPTYTPHVDTGDFVIVVNVDKLKVTGNKLEDKNYYSYSGYPGGMKVTSLEKMLDHKPEHVLMHAVAGMLPKNKLGRAMIKKLKIYASADHPHEAQKPEPLQIQM